MDLIKLSDVLNLMDDVDQHNNPIPFSIEFFTKEGRKVVVDKAVKCITKKSGKVVYDGNKKRKAPNHFKNATRNIHIPVSNQIRKLNIRLITKFNGIKVAY